MENKYRILGTLSDDEATVKKMSTRLNTKKTEKSFFFVPELNQLVFLLPLHTVGAPVQRPVRQVAPSGKTQILFPGNHKSLQ